MYYYGGIDPETLLQTELNPQCVCLFEYQLVKKKKLKLCCITYHLRRKH
jgi:hypothetical protein